MRVDAVKEDPKALLSRELRQRIMQELKFKLLESFPNYETEARIAISDLLHTRNKLTILAVLSALRAKIKELPPLTVIEDLILRVRAMPVETTKPATSSPRHEYYCTLCCRGEFFTTTTWATSEGAAKVNALAQLARGKNVQVHIIMAMYKRGEIRVQVETMPQSQPVNACDTFHVHTTGT